MNKSNCTSIEESLTSYALGDLSGAQAEKVAEHLESCDRCRALLEELKPTLQLLEDALAAPAGAAPSLDSAHRAKVLSVGPATREPSRWVWTLAKAALLLGGSFFLVLMLWPKISGSPLQTAKTDSRGREYIEVKIGREANLELEAMEQTPVAGGRLELASVVPPEHTVDESLLLVDARDIPESSISFLGDSDDGHISGEGESSIYRASRAQGNMAPAAAPASRGVKTPARTDALQAAEEATKDLLLASEAFKSKTLSRGRKSEARVAAAPVAEQNALAFAGALVASTEGIKERDEKLSWVTAEIKKATGEYGWMLQVQVDRPGATGVTVQVVFEDESVTRYRRHSLEDDTRWFYEVELPEGVLRPEGTLHLQVDGEDSTVPLHQLLDPTVH